MNRKINASPYLIWALIFILIPLALVVFYAVTLTGENGEVQLTFEAFKRAFEPLYLSVYIRSIRLAFICTVFCLLLGYPVAYIMSRKDFNTKSTLLFLFLVPMWMNFLLRTYSWLTILEKNGIINSFFALFGVGPFNMLYSDGAVVLGMVYNFLPFMILPVYTILNKMDTSIIEAAEDLGANSINVFLKVVFPLSLSGVISGITMVFMPAVSTFIISNLLGGGQYMLIGNLIEQQFLRVYDWNFGSTLSIVLMAIILIMATLLSFADSEKEEVQKI